MDDLPDITSPQAYVAAVPHAAFAELRDQAPVSFHQEAHGGSGHWALVRYDDVVMAGRDWSRFSAERGTTLEEMSDEELEARRSLMDMDPPAHTRLRRLLGRGFTPRVVRAYEKTFRLMTRDTLDAVLVPSSEFDFVAEVSKTIPALWLCEHLGLDHELVGRVVDWSDKMLLGGSDPDYLEDRSAPELRLAPFGSAAGRECFEYAAGIAADRRATPRDDVITEVLFAEPGGEPLTDSEFKNFFAVLMIAGQEASRHSISAGTLALMERPDEVALLRDQPEIIDTAVEEIIRWATPIYHFRRTTTEDVTMHSVTIPTGSKVTLWYISANFDPDVFNEPLTFDINRNHNDHVAFGKGGPHHCLGAPLGRLQVKVVVEEMLPWFDRLELAGPVERLQSNLINGIKHMPVRVA